MPLKLTTYYHGSNIPELPGNNTFHSIELFHIYEATPGYTPLLIVASEARKAQVAKLLAGNTKSVRFGFHPLSSRDVKSMAQENISMKQSIKNLSLAKSSNG